MYPFPVSTYPFNVISIHRIISIYHVVKHGATILYLYMYALYPRIHVHTYLTYLFVVSICKIKMNLRLSMRLDIHSMYHVDASIHTVQA
jgi:hypothetical protein